MQRRDERCPQESSTGLPGGQGTRHKANRKGRQMGGSDGGEVFIHHSPPSRGGRGRGFGNYKRPTLVHSEIQESLDEDDRSASLKAIQEAHRIMMMHHCRQSWEDTECSIGFGLPLEAVTETPHWNTGLHKQTEVDPGTSLIAPTINITARQLDKEPLDRGPHSAEVRDPEPHRREAKKGELHYSSKQTPASDRKTGGAKGRRNTGTTATDTQPRATKQGASSRGKPTKSTGPHSTTSPLDAAVHKDIARRTQQKNTPSPQSATDEQLEQKNHIVDTGTESPQTYRANPDRDLELLRGPTPQGQVDPGLDLHSDTTATERSIPTMSRPESHRKGQPVTKNIDRAKSTPPIAAAVTALLYAPTHIPTVKKEEGPAPILTPAQLQSIAKRRRQQLRAKLPKNPTACFYLSTLVLKWTFNHFPQAILKICPRR